jgi:hypothetical protein
MSVGRDTPVVRGEERQRALFCLAFVQDDGTSEKDLPMFTLDESLEFCDVVNAHPGSLQACAQ